MNSELLLVFTVHGVHCSREEREGGCFYSSDCAFAGRTFVSAADKESLPISPASLVIGVARALYIFLRKRIYPTQQKAMDLELK